MEKNLLWWPSSSSISRIGFPKNLSIQRLLHFKTFGSRIEINAPSVIPNMLETFHTSYKKFCFYILILWDLKKENREEKYIMCCLYISVIHIVREGCIFLPFLSSFSCLKACIFFNSLKYLNIALWKASKILTEVSLFPNLAVVASDVRWSSDCIACKVHLRMMHWLAGRNVCRSFPLMISASSFPQVISAAKHIYFSFWSLFISC